MGLLAFSPLATLWRRFVAYVAESDGALARFTLHLRAGGVAARSHLHQVIYDLRPFEGPPMFLSKVQYDAVMAAMQYAEQPRELNFGPQQHPTEFAKLYNTLWVADRLRTAIGEEKWWFRIDTEPSPVPLSLPTARQSMGKARVLPTANTPPVLKSAAAGDSEWPQQNAASSRRRDHAPRSGTEVSRLAASRGRRLVDAMTGARPTAQTKEKITYNAYLKRRWVDAKSGEFVPPHTIGSMRRTAYDAMRRVDPNSGVRLAGDMPPATCVERAALHSSWRPSRQQGAFRSKISKEVSYASDARTSRRAKAATRAASRGTLAPNTAPPPTAGQQGTVSTPRPSSKNQGSSRSPGLQP